MERETTLLAEGVLIDFISLFALLIAAISMVFTVGAFICSL